jgi:hypothetical protein
MRSAPLIHSVLFSLLLVGPGALAAQNLPGGNPRDYGERQRRAAEQYRRELLHDVTGTFGRWKRAWADDDAGDTADFYTDDAVIIIPTQSAAYRGKDDVEQFLEDLLPTLGELSTDIIEFDAGDRLAYLIVRFSSPPSCRARSCRSSGWKAGTGRSGPRLSSSRAPNANPKAPLEPRSSSHLRLALETSSSNRHPPR